MLNLLKYDRQAKDGEGSGRDAYERYGDEMQKIMADRRNQALWRGRADSVIIGDDDADDWDAVLLVEYPSRKVFLEMSGEQGVRGRRQAPDVGAGGFAADRLHGAGALRSDDQCRAWVTGRVDAACRYGASNG